MYSYCIVNWTKAELKRIDTKTRKLLTSNRAHHPKADVDRIYIKRAEGGRGLLQVESTNQIATIGLQQYLETTTDWMMQCVRVHESNKKLYSVEKKSSEYKKELNYVNQPIITKDATSSAKQVKIIAKKRSQEQLKERWKEKPLHGKFFKRTSDADISKKETFSWLKSSSLKSETEGFLMAAQDQSLKTKNYLANVMKITTDASCRYCNKFTETVDHLVAGCPMLARQEYLTRHNRVAQYVHWKICNHYGFKTSPKWYEHETPPVVENNEAAILWDFSIQTDRSIPANRPDIVIRDKKDKTCFLIDVSVPSDTNTSLKTYEKLTKYKDLETELQRSWKLTTKTIPIIIGALGCINKNVQQYLNAIPGKIDLYEIQKITLLGTANILRKALSMNIV